MPDFTCTVCSESFSIPEAALEKYPGWEPKYCRTHSPNNKKSKTAQKPPGSKKRGSRAPNKKTVHSNREECLTRAEVLLKYQDGESTGVFTDGSSHPNPGPGGWGFVWVDDGEIKVEKWGDSPDTTNNRMELTALIEAFKALPEDASVTVYTDSQLCVNTITQWAPAWEKKGWKRKGGPVKNLELVKELLALYRAHPKCKLKWTAAHVGSRWNEYADSLATAWRREEV